MAAKLNINILFLALAIVYLSSARMLLVHGVADTPYMKSGNPVLDACAKKITLGCGFSIYKSVFAAESPAVACCQQLVFMGKTCHNQIVQNAISIPELKVNVIVARMEAEEIWNLCVKVDAALRASA